MCTCIHTSGCTCVHESYMPIYPDVHVLHSVYTSSVDTGTISNVDVIENRILLMHTHTHCKENM